MPDVVLSRYFNRNTRQIDHFVTMYSTARRLMIFHSFVVIRHTSDVTLQPVFSQQHFTAALTRDGVWPGFEPYLTALRYLVYFRFCECE